MVETTRPQPLARDAMAYVLAGGRGSRLKELTDRRAKPAVYFGGKTRIIDFALSNALNSGIRRLGVATQYKAHSLIRHLQRGWNFLRPERNESFDILPASQRVSETQWYEGTADAVYQNIDIIESYNPEYMVVLAGDHIYKMDYELMLRQHVDDGADVTVGCLPPAHGSERLRRDAGRCRRNITDFFEKPADPPGSRRAASRPRLDGHYVFDLRLPPTAPPRCRRPQLQPRFRQGISHVGSLGRAVGAPLRGNPAAVPARGRALLARCLHRRCYWGPMSILTDVVPDIDLFDRAADYGRMRRSPAREVRP